VVLDPQFAPLQCLACHSIAGGDKLGPDLYQVTKSRDEAWLSRWLHDPQQAMLETDPIAKEMLTKYKIPMPNQNASDQEIKGYLAYFNGRMSTHDPKARASPSLHRMLRAVRKSRRPHNLLAWCTNDARNIYPVHGLMRSP
jgi:Cytochrome c